MKKMTKLVLALVIAASLSTMTGCNKKEEVKEEAYKTKEDFKGNVQSKKKVVVDGEELDEYTMNDGMKVQGAGLEDVVEGSDDAKDNE
jgi:ribosomal protein L28